MVTIYTFLFYFSVVLAVIKGEKPGSRGFPRQPARQPDSNRGATGGHFSEWKLHLFCDLHKTIHRFSDGLPESVAGFFTLPALLSAIFGKQPCLGNTASRNALVHYLVDFPDFPLLRLVKGMVQGFLVELLGTDHAPGVLIKIRLYHSGFWCPPAQNPAGVLLRYRCTGGLKASLNLPLPCIPSHLPDIGSGSGFPPQNVKLGNLGVRPRGKSGGCGDGKGREGRGGGGSHLLPRGAGCGGRRTDFSPGCPS